MALCPPRRWRRFGVLLATTFAQVITSASAQAQARTRAEQARGIESRGIESRARQTRSGGARSLNAAISTGADSTAPARSLQISASAWLMGLTGTVRPSSVAPTATLDASANPVWERDNASSYVTLLHRRNAFMLAGDLSGFASTDSGRVDSSEAALVSQQVTALTITPGYAWRESERGSVSVLAGVRIWRMQSAVRVPAVQSRNETRTSYYDVVVATRVERRLGPATATVYADAGGFQIASDLTWQVAGTIVLRAAPQWSLVTGYRHLSVDYRGDGKQLSLVMYGPTFGAAMHF